MGFVLTSDVSMVLAFGYDLVIDENFKLVRTTARGERPATRPDARI